MFDDVVQPPKSGSTPPNLPVGEPEDMFQETDSNDTGTIPASVSNDISEPVLTPNTALDAGVLRPKVTSMNTVPVVPPPNSSGTQNMPPQAEANPRPQQGAQSYTIQTPPSPFLSGSENYPQPAGSAAAEAPFSGRKILIFVGVILVLIVLGVGSLYIYTHFIKNNAVDDFPSTDIETTTSDTNSLIIPPITNPTSTDTTSDEDSILFGEPVDTDGDGISDVDEAKYGTDTLNWDTDADELSDGDEVMIWKTDPRVFDSDSDGYGDGVEIKNGYNPTGTGKLFEPPTSTSVGVSTTL